MGIKISKWMRFIVLFLSSFTLVSKADEALSCPEKPYYIRFDGTDMETCNFIIDYGLSDKRLVSESSVIVSIYTEKHFEDQRDYWVASFAFGDGSYLYYIYNNKENKINAVNSKEFTEKFQSINRCNARPEMPLFKTVVSN